MKHGIHGPFFYPLCRAGVETAYRLFASCDIAQIVLTGTIFCNGAMVSRAPHFFI